MMIKRRKEDQGRKENKKGRNREKGRHLAKLVVSKSKNRCKHERRGLPQKIDYQSKATLMMNTYPSSITEGQKEMEAIKGGGGHSTS